MSEVRRTPKGGIMEPVVSVMNNLKEEKKRRGEEKLRCLGRLPKGKTHKGKWVKSKNQIQKRTR